MSTTLFEYPVTLSPSWEDGTTYQYFLKEAPAVKPGGPVRLQAAQELNPNVIVRREAANGRRLDDFAAEQKKVISKKIPGLKLLREGKSKLGALAAVEQEYTVTLEHPLPSVAQWHAFLERDGHLYEFCGTSPRDRLEAHKKAFRALVESWAKS